MGRFAGNSGALALHFLVLAGQFDGTEGNLRPSNAPHGVREVHAPHAWGTCYAHAPLTNSIGYTAGQSTGQQIRNWKTGRVCILNFLFENGWVLH